MDRGIVRAVQRYLLAESWRLAEDSATEIGAYLEPSTVGAYPRRVYAILKRWYRHASAQAPNPYRTDMEKIR